MNRTREIEAKYKFVVYQILLIIILLYKYCINILEYRTAFNNNILFSK